MRLVNCVHLRNHLSETLNIARYANERIEVRRRGRFLAAIIPLEDWHYLRVHKVVDAPTRARRASRDLQALGIEPPPELERIVRWPSTSSPNSYAAERQPGREGPDPWDGLL